MTKIKRRQFLKAGLSASALVIGGATAAKPADDSMVIGSAAAAKPADDSMVIGSAVAAKPADDSMVIGSSTAAKLADDPMNGYITGMLFYYSSRDGVGVAGVEITLTGVSANGTALTLKVKTDENGWYHFRGLPEGRYTIEVTGMLPSTMTLSFQPATRGPFVLNHLPGGKFQITDSASFPVKFSGASGSSNPDSDAAGQAPLNATTPRTEPPAPPAAALSIPTTAPPTTAPPTTAPPTTAPPTTAPPTTAPPTTAPPTTAPPTTAPPTTAPPTTAPPTTAPIPLAGTLSRNSRTG